MIDRLKFAAVAAFLLFATVAIGEPIPQLKPGGYVNDFAHVLTPSTQQTLTSVGEQLDQQAHAQIALVTINSLDGQDIESYAVELFKQWGIGYKGTDRGVLILYVIQDRRARVEVGYGLEPILPDGKVGGFQREAIPQMRSGDYDGALSLVFMRVAQTIADDAHIQISGATAPPPSRAPDQYREVHLTLGQMIMIFIVIVIIMASPLRGIVFWILLNMLSGGGGRGGGGFGGGGGGFGGFGGGSSGGGGASSSW